MITSWHSDRARLGFRRGIHVMIEGVDYKQLRLMLNVVRSTTGIQFRLTRYLVVTPLLGDRKSKWEVMPLSD